MQEFLETYDSWQGLPATSGWSCDVIWGGKQDTCLVMYWAERRLDELEKEEGFYITIDFKEIDLEGNTGINYYYNLKENKVIENYVKE